MKLFLIAQNTVTGFDSYDSAVVAAESENDARNIHPSDCITHAEDGQWFGTYRGDRLGNYSPPEPQSNTGWPDYSCIQSISVEYLGETERDRGVVCASYNAG